MKKELSDNNSVVKPVTATIGSFAGLLSVIYGIILTLSMSYNIGYFKELNPQIIELMTLGDYINDTIHNLWFFIIGLLILFGCFLAVLKMQKKDSFYIISLVGIFTFIVSSAFLLKGFYHSKFWPTIKVLLLSNESTIIRLTIISALILCITFLVYKFTIKIIKHTMSDIALGLSPLILLMLLIIMPYLGGITHGYIENKFLERADYATYSVSITTLPKEELLNDLYIIKKIEKGLILRKCHAPSSEGVIFLNWNNIKTIKYEVVE